MRKYAEASEGRMNVSVGGYVQEVNERFPFPTRIDNVIARLEGSSDPSRVYVVSGHYDSRVTDIDNYTDDAPGANDDASGVAQPYENFAHQHQDNRIENGQQFGDLPEFVDYEFVARVAKVNMAALWSLAQAPGSVRNLTIDTSILGNNSTLSWLPRDDAELQGCEIFWRPTNAPLWTRVVEVGNVNSATVPLSKDNLSKSSPFNNFSREGIFPHFKSVSSLLPPSVKRESGIQPSNLQYTSSITTMSPRQSSDGKTLCDNESIESSSTKASTTSVLKNMFSKNKSDKDSGDKDSVPKTRAEAAAASRERRDKANRAAAFATYVSLR
ncbi:hypothetical protein BKA80DRAFT_251998 [Phyllosticta citrichinensis]